jgi:hypothetical protein
VDASEILQLVVAVVAVVAGLPLSLLLRVKR